MIRFANSLAATVFAVLCATACSSETTDTPKEREVAVTDVGVPSGAAVTTTIGPSGGVIVSADGQLTLVVPANAVESETTFSITPITATGPGSLTAYRLGPEGTTFDVPASITMKYTDADVAGSSPELLSISYQTEKRTWRTHPAPDLDTDQKTITVTTTHLSDWSKFQGAALKPSEANVKVNEQLHLEVKVCELTDPEDPDELAYLDTYPCFSYAEDTDPILRGAAVNGIPGGNGSVGTIARGSTYVYTAPKKVPSPPLVAVSVQFSPKRVLLVSNVTVFDEFPTGALPRAYSGSVTYSLKSGGGNATRFDLDGSAHVALTDKSASDSGEYSMDVGEFEIDGGFIEGAAYDCVPAGTTMCAAGLGVSLEPADHSFSLSIGGNAQVSCTRKSGTGQLPSTLPVYSSFVSGPGGTIGECTDTVTKDSSNINMLVGSFRRTCPDRTETASWSLEAMP